MPNQLICAGSGAANPTRCPKPSMILVWRVNDQLHVFWFEQKWKNKQYQYTTLKLCSASSPLLNKYSEIVGLEAVPSDRLQIGWGDSTARGSWMSRCSMRDVSKKFFCEHFSKHHQCLHFQQPHPNVVEWHSVRVSSPKCPPDSAEVQLQGCMVPALHQSWISSDHRVLWLGFCNLGWLLTAPRARTFGKHSSHKASEFSGFLHAEDATVFSQLFLLKCAMRKQGCPLQGWSCFLLVDNQCFAMQSNYAGK